MSDEHSFNENSPRSSKDSHSRVSFQDGGLGANIPNQTGLARAGHRPQGPSMISFAQQHLLDAGYGNFVDPHQDMLGFAAPPNQVPVQGYNPYQHQQVYGVENTQPHQQGFENVSGYVFDQFVNENAWNQSADVTTGNNPANMPAMSSASCNEFNSYSMHGGSMAQLQPPTRNSFQIPATHHAGIPRYIASQPGPHGHWSNTAPMDRIPTVALFEQQTAGQVKAPSRSVQENRRGRLPVQPRQIRPNGVVPNTGNFIKAATPIAGPQATSGRKIKRPRQTKPARQASAKPVHLQNLVPDAETGVYGSTYEDALNSITPQWWLPPMGDDPLPSTDQEKRKLVLRLRNAILNTQDTNDKKSNAYKFRWERAHPPYLVQYVDRVAWSIMQKVIDLYRNGFTAPIFDPAQDASFDKEMPFKERMDKLIELFSFWKTSCDNVMKGEKINSYIHGPASSIKRISGNKASNIKRAERLAWGKAAEEAAAAKSEVAEHKDAEGDDIEGEGTKGGDADAEVAETEAADGSASHHYQPHPANCTAGVLLTPAKSLPSLSPSASTAPLAPSRPGLNATPTNMSATPQAAITNSHSPSQAVDLNTTHQKSKRAVTNEGPKAPKSSGEIDSLTGQPHQHPGRPRQGRNKRKRDRESDHLTPIKNQARVKFTEIMDDLNKNVAMFEEAWHDPQDDSGYLSAGK
ncbi:hypothetical protein K432DRAFT_422953 [Lepidopterella palustris CBS 459.81]|uniref:Uncharacterized protein n=1 Tax=Lepidopterella palustris CBS 459.81 TaxID=1314670 RepID=A0A8E2JII0_9PEZI|nr:hypothetical protein K432DRAFT_422953 [Lepidopterella palustris CBS 459.81]